MSDDEEVRDSVPEGGDDRFTKVENDVYNPIEGYGEEKPEEVKIEEEVPVENEKSKKDSKKKENKNKNVQKLKIIFLGEKGVGKSSIIDKYVDNKFTTFEDGGEREAVKHKKIKIDANLTADLSINDTSEVENLEKIPRSYYTDAHGAVLVFNLADQKSFQKLQFWLDELNNYAPKDIIICFLGNQSDRTADRKVEFEEAKNLAGDNLYYEVSAKAGNNITLAFEALTNNIIDKQKEEEKNPDKVKRGKEGRNTIDINSNKKQGNEKKKKCC